MRTTVLYKLNIKLSGIDTEVSHFLVFYDVLNAIVMDRKKNLSDFDKKAKLL